MGTNETQWSSVNLAADAFNFLEQIHQEINEPNIDLKFTITKEAPRKCWSWKKQEQPKFVL